MTKEELLAAVEAKMNEWGIKQGGALMEAMEAYMNRRFAIPAAGTGRWSAAAAKAIVDLKYREGNSAPVPIGLPGYDLKPGQVLAPLEALYTKDVTTSQFPPPREVLPFVPFPQRVIRVRDLMPVIGTAATTVDYARITGFSNNAAVQAEGALKGQSEITVVRDSKAAKVIATFMPVSRLAVADTGNLQAWLESTLEYFVTLAEDDQILNGVGPGAEHLDGILQDPNIQTQAVGAEASPATPKLIAIRKAITKIQTAFTSSGGEPNGLVIHPSDAEDLDLLTDTTGRYLLLPDGSPANAEAARNVWGLRVVVTPAIAAGTGLVGDFARAAALYVVEGMTVRVTDSHSDYFRRNLLAMLAEVREMLTLPFPSFFCKVTGL